METIFIIKITFAICVFLTGVGLAVANIIIHFSIHEGIYKYDGNVIIGSLSILIVTIITCAIILFA